MRRRSLLMALGVEMDVDDAIVLVREIVIELRML